MSYGDYVEQLTLLLFLKMADEKGDSAQAGIPSGFEWPRLVEKKGEDLANHYQRTLEALGEKPGVLKLIFAGATNRFRDPLKLQRVIVDLIDSENWSGYGGDVKADAYEGLLEKNAQDTKSGAGQYFTPRVIVDAIVSCIRPKLGERICDPACGTGGFLTSSAEHIRSASGDLSSKAARQLRDHTFFGVEIVQSTARICAMNLLLHGIGSERHVPVEVRDVLESSASPDYDVVLANPPFGRRSGLPSSSQDVAEKESADADVSIAPVSTSNKQLNFVQHIIGLLKPGGRAAVVVPDNVLFEGGAGEVVRQNLLEYCNLHTMLRLPAGIFYAQGVKANVLFFERRKTGARGNDKLWVYDLRGGRRFTVKTNPLTKDDLKDFVTSYCADNQANRSESWSAESPSGKWRSYAHAELLRRPKVNLDLAWLEDGAVGGGDDVEVDQLLSSIASTLQSALDEIRSLSSEFEGSRAS